MSGGAGVRIAGRRIAAILFDKDGTLLDYRQSWAPVNREAALLAAAGDAVLARRLLAAGGADPETGMAEPDSVLAAGATHEIAACWCRAGGASAPEILTRALDDLFTRAASRMVPVTDLARLFARLRACGLKLGIASSDSRAAIVATLRQFRCADAIDFIAGYDSGFGTKPGPGMLLAFCAAVGVAPVEAAVIGDNAHDMAMGQAGGAGLRIGVLTGTGTAATLSAIADLCLASVADLPALLV